MPQTLKLLDNLLYNVATTFFYLCYVLSAVFLANSYFLTMTHSYGAGVISLLLGILGLMSSALAVRRWKPRFQIPGLALCGLMYQIIFMDTSVIWAFMGMCVYVFSAVLTAWSVPVKAS